MQTKACDTCRKRKIKCVPQDGIDGSPESGQGSSNGQTKPVRCVGCTALGLDCTYHHIKRRPGRPNSFAPTGPNGPYSRPNNGSSSHSGQGMSMLPSRTRSPGANLGVGSGYGTAGAMRGASSALDDLDHAMSGHVWATPGGQDVVLPGMSLGRDSFSTHAGDVPGLEALRTGTGQGYALGNDFGAAQGATSLSHAHMPAPFGQQNHYGLQVNDSSPTFSSPMGQGNGSIPSASFAGPSHAPASLDSLLNSRPPSNPLPRTSIVSWVILPPPPQIEDVTSFNHIFFFISLYLRHLHAHMPVVHKPTFTQQLAMRIDQRDEEFRALLLSLTSYVISQSPKSRMIEYYTQSELEKLQDGCYQASQVLQSRRYRKPTLILQGTLMADYIKCISSQPSRHHKASAILGEAAALAYSMGIHDESKMAAEGLDHIQLQLSRRCFWHLYTIDKTEVSANKPSHMHDCEGVPDYPQEVDDDLITSQGTFQQPPDRVSFMVGFVACTKLFRIMSECLVRHRFFQHQPYGSDSLNTEVEWVFEAHDRIATIFDQLPVELSSIALSKDAVGVDADASAIFAMQRANLLITAASVKFALFDLRETLSADRAAVAAEQETESKAMYKLLSSIPLDALAANGESMRGKVLRIICALLNRASTPDRLSESLQDWWSMFSVLPFVQVVKQDLDSVLPSRQGSPELRLPTG